MFKKVSLPVLVTVMCLMVAVVVGLVYLNQKNQKKVKVVQKTNSEVSRTDYSAVARKTLDWIDKQRNDQGWYILERGCDFNKKTCDTVWDNQEGNKDGLIATWARFNFYNQTKDPKDLEIVKSDIDKFYEKYPNGVDNALWICKITFDMWKSDLFDQTTKDKLEKICFETKILDLISDNQQYGEWRKSLFFGLNSNNPIWQSWKGYTGGVRGFDSYFGISSDILNKYLWDKDTIKLELAKEYFESGKKILIEQGNLARADDVCLLGLSAIDLYKYAGNNEEYLKYAQEKYLSFSNEFDGPKKYSTFICGLMGKELYKIDRNILFLNGLERNNKVMMGSLLDGVDSYSNITGTYGFFITDSGSFSFPFKNVVENGLIVELLRD